MITDRLTRLIEEIIREFMSNPDEVKVTAIPLERSATIKIDVHPSEVGRVIGEQGSHFKSFEKICLAFGHKHKQPVELMPMIEPDSDVVPAQYGKFKGRDDWRKNEITKIVIQAAKAVFRNEDAVEVAVRDMANFVSVFTIRVSRTEDSDVVHLMQNAFKAIFNAVGRANGRVLIVDVVAAGKGGESKQPKSAGGRFCREVRR